ncbi:hypothetical protein SAMN04488557_1426 [Hyphomicrobium facile]|uniref:Uncharacterized protein n=1 Tax=Hyphomicrobium facile TaxID=51670 RepID=A0A1I7NB23_9HYPH|nr:hypothetical protein SAMN04488557_1426 [Hyphomicrobium facile]
MNVHCTMIGLRSAGRRRALMLVRDAIAKREASLASALANRPSMHATGSTDPLSPQGGK